MLCSTSMTLTHHVWIRSRDLHRPMQQTMLNMSTSLQGDDSPMPVRLCICSARRSIRRILASFLHAQTGLHLQQLGLHTQQQTKYTTIQIRGGIWYKKQFSSLGYVLISGFHLGCQSNQELFVIAVGWCHLTSLPAVPCLTDFERIKEKKR